MRRENGEKEEQALRDNGTLWVDGAACRCGPGTAALDGAHRCVMYHHPCVGEVEKWRKQYSTTRIVK